MEATFLESCKITGDFWTLNSIKFPSCTTQRGLWKVRRHLGSPCFCRGARSNPWRRVRATVGWPHHCCRAWWEENDKEVGANKERRSADILPALSPRLAYSATPPLQATALCKPPPTASPSPQHVSTACSHSSPWPGTWHPDTSTLPPQYLRCTAVGTTNSSNPYSLVADRRIPRVSVTTYKQEIMVVESRDIVNGKEGYIWELRTGKNWRKRGAAAFLRVWSQAEEILY